MDSNGNLDRAKRIALQQLHSLRNSGLHFMPKAAGKHEFGGLRPAEAELSLSIAPTSTPAAAEPSSRRDEASNRTQEAKPSFVHDTGTPLTAYESELEPTRFRVDKLSIVKAEVANCTKCPELSSCRTNTVFGVGSAEAELCFLGEGPGADEDRQGVPFVGQAGQLLDKIIGACKMSREEVYILNTVKCRPPGNRNPTEQELANCWPYTIQQLEILQPKFICCLGSVAAKTLLNTKQSIGKMRGQFFQYRGSKVVVTYHPAYLLRNPAAKRKVWDDMKLLLAAMGREI